jgi:hypothetical protein
VDSLVHSEGEWSIVNGEYLNCCFIHHCPLPIHQYKSATQQKPNTYSIAGFPKIIFTAKEFIKIQQQFDIALSIH